MPPFGHLANLSQVGSRSCSLAEVCAPAKCSHPPRRRHRSDLRLARRRTACVLHHVGVQARVGCQASVRAYQVRAWSGTNAASASSSSRSLAMSAAPRSAKAAPVAPGRARPRAQPCSRRRAGRVVTPRREHPRSSSPRVRSRSMQTPGRGRRECARGPHAQRTGRSSLWRKPATPEERPGPARTQDVVRLSGMSSPSTPRECSAWRRCGASSRTRTPWTPSCWTSSTTRRTGSCCDAGLHRRSRSPRRMGRTKGSRGSGTCDGTHT